MSTLPEYVYLITTPGDPSVTAVPDGGDPRVTARAVEEAVRARTRNGAPAQRAADWDHPVVTRARLAELTPIAYSPSRTIGPILEPMA